MRKSILLIAVMIACLLSSSVQAGRAANILGVCLTDSMTGRERKNLAKWIFFAIAAHPEIKSYSRVTETDQDQTNQLVGKLITRLMTEDCPAQAKAALKKDGAAALEQAFGLVGQVAMQELMTDNAVSQSISGFENYLDQAKFIELSK